MAISGIKSWAEEDRPREKLLLKGKEALSDAELLAILIRSGKPGVSAVELARRILAKADNNLVELGKLSLQELMAGVKGIGRAKALSIVAALELGRRRRFQEGIQKETVITSRNVYEIMHPRIGDLKHEEFWVLFLNTASRLIDKSRVSSGGTAGVNADVRLIYKLAFEKLAHSIVLCHNHPSGNVKPSETDLLLTRKLKNAGQVMGIPVVDHLIIADSGFFSFADEKIL